MCPCPTGPTRTVPVACHAAKQEGRHDQHLSRCSIDELFESCCRSAVGIRNAGNDRSTKPALGLRKLRSRPTLERARFDVRLSPVTADQEITVSSGDPANRERTEFILKTRPPEKAVPGEWHIKIVYLFLAGTSWTSNTLATNPDFRFVVEGPKVEIPTRATASLVDDKH